MENRAFAHTHIYLVCICVMTCGGISEMGIWKSHRYTTGMLAGGQPRGKGKIQNLL